MKNKKTIFIIVTFIIAVALIVINRSSTQQQIDMANKMQLSFTVAGEEKVYYYDENHAEYTSFDTQMKRKNGDVFDKNYSGIPLITILNEMDVEITAALDLSVVCADQYEIQLTADEILAENNIWLITKESGEKLAETDGPFMLVVNNDEFSTRWAKTVVRIKIK